MSWLVVGVLLLLLLIASQLEQLKSMIRRGRAGTQERERSRSWGSCGECVFFDLRDPQEVLAREEELDRLREDSPEFAELPMANTVRDLIRESRVGYCRRWPPPGRPPRRERELQEIVLDRKLGARILSKVDEQNAKRVSDDEEWVTHWFANRLRFPLVSPTDWCGEFRRRD